MLRHAVHTDVAGSLQRRRRRAPDALPGRTPAAAADGRAPAVRRGQRRVAAPLGAVRRLLARADRVPHLRSRRRHHPDARARSASSRRTRPPRRSPTSAARCSRPAGAPSGSSRAPPTASPTPPAPPWPSCRRQESSMGDAEIIPIGTRGRPGRGTGKQPSSAARGLASGAKAAPATAKPPAASGGREAQAQAEAEAEVQAEARGAERGRGRVAPGGHDRGPRARRRHPGLRLARGDPARSPRGLRVRLGAAAGPLPRLPAPTRRRQLRDRRVRLRPRDHRALLHGDASADRAEVVPDRGPRRGEPPRRGRRAGRLQPLRHRSRSTA